MKILLTFLLLSFQTARGQSLNCLDEGHDPYETMICLFLVDTTKLQRVNCLVNPEPDLCESVIVPRSTETLDCLKGSHTEFEEALCATVPRPESLFFIDCYEDGQNHVQQCQNVNVLIQQEIRERL